jgi:hypothetical protein
VLHRFVILNALTIASNLLPFVGLDGQLILADAIGEPDLAPRARRSLRDVFVRDSAGVPRGEKVALASYATLNGLVAIGLLALSSFFWYELFADALAALVDLGPLGWAVAVVALALAVQPALRAANVLQRVNVLGRNCRTTIVFRGERAWRVAGARRLALLPELADLDPLALGIVAGQLCRVPRQAGTSRFPLGEYALPSADGRNWIVLTEEQVTTARRVAAAHHQQR